MDKALITRERRRFHQQLLEQQLLTLSPCTKSTSGYIASNGDSGQKFSATLSQELAERLARSCGARLHQPDRKLDGQRLGNLFESLCCDFIKRSFLRLEHLRPGHWLIEKVTGRSESMLSRFSQYTHLADLTRLAAEHEDLATFLGHGYTVSPDVILARFPETDASINQHQLLVDDQSARMSSLRSHETTSEAHLLLHASISCKFTMRSDRAQNTRTEALNLIRNRKGRTPHIVAVTAEPTPGRLASLALGTGDIDCVYHFALYELQEALAALEYEDALHSLNIMIDGQRLKDISDLPLDLAI